MQRYALVGSCASCVVSVVVACRSRGAFATGPIAGDSIYVYIYIYTYMCVYPNVYMLDCLWDCYTWKFELSIYIPRASASRLGLGPAFLPS